MAIHIFNLRDVPNDEAEDVRQLLTEHGIEFYETPPGRWGISSPGLWITDDAQRERVKALIAAYQDERGRRVRQLYEEQRAQGLHPTVWQSVARHPLRFVGVMAAVGFILYVSVRPFMTMIGL